MFRLDGKVAVVTGGARGIGAAITRALATAGARTVIIDRTVPAPGDPAGAPDGRGDPYAIEADVSDPAQVESAFAAVLAAVGPVDILVNNAGITRPEDITEATAESWDTVLAVNARSAFLCAQAALDQMRRRRSGRIIQISSVVAHQGALQGHVHYAASKAALLGLTKTLARTCAPLGITVNAIAPGVIHTDLTEVSFDDTRRAELTATIPLGIGSVDDVAPAAVYLASDEARYVTGITLDVNGGLYIR